MNSFTQALYTHAALWVPKAIGVVLIIVFFIFLARIFRKAIFSAAERFTLDKNITPLLARTSSIAIMIFGIITALGTLGINVSALVAGLGLTGFALGFALKDTISNLLSGVLILFYRPFEVGNRVKISGYEGMVVSIDLRYTELESEGNKVLIPNSKLFTDPIVVLNPDIAPNGDVHGQGTSR